MGQKGQAKKKYLYAFYSYSLAPKRESNDERNECIHSFNWEWGAGFNLGKWLLKFPEIETKKKKKKNPFYFLKCLNYFLELKNFFHSASKWRRAHRIIRLFNKKFIQNESDDLLPQLNKHLQARRSKYCEIIIFE